MCSIKVPPKIIIEEDFEENEKLFRMANYNPEEFLK